MRTIPFLLTLFVLPTGWFPAFASLTGYSGPTGGNLAGAKSNTPGGYDLSYDYDALNRLIMVHRGQEGIDPAATELAACNYDPNGNLNGTGYANGVQHAYTYNTLNRLTDLSIRSRDLTVPSSSFIPLQGYSYQLDRNGLRTHITEHSGRTIAHTFDALQRLTSETISSSLITDHRSLGTLSYTYDAASNRSSRTTSGTVAQLLPNQTQTFTANDRLTSDTYDANGNTTSSTISDPQSTIINVADVYSFDNKLIRRTRADGLTIDLTYNPDGHRLTKLVSQSGLTQRVHHYLTDPNSPTGYSQVVEEKDPLAPEGQQLQKVHLYGHDLIATRSADLQSASSDSVSYYLYDGLGSVRGITNETGDLQETYDYDAYGTLIGLTKRNAEGVLESTPITNNESPITKSEHLFTGEQWDSDLNMYFLRARYLNTSTGRFHTQDTYEGRNGEPLTLHKYLYCHGNPVMNMDPSGNVTLGEMATTFAVSGSINAAFCLGFRLLTGKQDPKSFWSDLGTDFVIGGLTAPIGGLFSKVFGPVVRSMFAPVLRTIGSLGRITATGIWQTGGRRLLVNMSRNLFNTNRNYPSVASTWMGGILKKLFPNVQWEMHHVFIQQAWSRAGSAHQLYDDVLANEGLRRLGNGYWNLMPIPRSLNGLLGANTEQGRFLTSVFATTIYSTVVFGPSQAISNLIYD